MTDFRNSIVSAQLAKRVSSTNCAPAMGHFESSQIPEGLCEHLREHLSAGETHYTARPGLIELRQAIGQQIGELGCRGRDADGVIVTQGEGEALYVTLLGLGIGQGSTISITGNCEHRALLDMLGIGMVGANDPNGGNADVCYSQVGDKLGGSHTEVPDADFEILAMGGLLFSERSRETDLSSVSTDAILIGHLDSLSGLDHFRMGYVAGPPDIVKRIQTWKQALSICSAAPSQRAAMFVISQRGVS